MAKNVNLDALVPREDFDIDDDMQGVTKNVFTISLQDLKKDSFFYNGLRKPDFQRETNEWDANKISDLIESFIDNDLIPSVILWRNNKGFTFVIDGAHRLSALVAWINDDYGDNTVSKLFYDSIIPEEQISTAEKTRQIIRKRIGPYTDYQLAITNPEKVEDKIVERAKSLGNLAINLQWVDGDAKKAESSFFKINQQAVSIDKTELKLLKCRRKPNGISARAIIRSGKGHKYWSSFPEVKQISIQTLSKEINEILFKPPLKTPIKTLDIPIAGKNLSSQGQMLVLEFINIVNGIDIKSELDDDLDGENTERYLKNCLKIARIINSDHPSSLGLHPAVYFYAKNGRHKPASFSAFVLFILELKKRNKFDEFIEVREKFESTLFNLDDVIQQIVRKYRSASAGFPHINSLLIKIMDSLKSEGNDDENINNILKLDEFSFINLENVPKDFTDEVKSEAFLREALSSAIKCKICGGYLHSKSISVDHIERKRNGGVGTIDNAQLTHPYCNTGFKN